MTPVRIQRKRAKGWQMPPDTVYVGRPTKWGNPFPIDCYGPDGAVDRFRRWITGHMSAREMSESSRCDPLSESNTSLVVVRSLARENLHYLRGKNLACWCRLDRPCHADVLLELVNTVRGG